MVATKLQPILQEGSSVAKEKMTELNKENLSQTTIDIFRNNVLEAAKKSKEVKDTSYQLVLKTKANETWPDLLQHPTFFQRIQETYQIIPKMYNSTPVISTAITTIAVSVIFIPLVKKGYQYVKPIIIQVVAKLRAGGENPYPYSYGAEPDISPLTEEDVELDSESDKAFAKKLIKNFFARIFNVITFLLILATIYKGVKSFLRV